MKRNWRETRENGSGKKMKRNHSKIIENKKKRKGKQNRIERK